MFQVSKTIYTEVRDLIFPELFEFEIFFVFFPSSCILVHVTLAYKFQFNLGIADIPKARLIW